MAYGIDRQVNTLAELNSNNPQRLQQQVQQSQGQDIVELLALQKIKNDKEAAARNIQMNQQPPAASIKDQLERQVMDMTRREVAQQVAPGLAIQGQRMQQPPMQRPPMQQPPMQQPPMQRPPMQQPPMQPQQPRMAAGGGLMSLRGFSDGGPVNPYEYQGQGVFQYTGADPNYSGPMSYDLSGNTGFSDDAYQVGGTYEYSPQFNMYDPTDYTSGIYNPENYSTGYYQYTDPTTGTTSYVNQSDYNANVAQYSGEPNKTTSSPYGGLLGYLGLGSFLNSMRGMGGYGYPPAAPSYSPFGMPMYPRRTPSYYGGFGGGYPGYNYGMGGIGSLMPLLMGLYGTQGATYAEGGQIKSQGEGGVAQPDPIIQQRMQDARAYMLALEIINDPNSDEQAKRNARMEIERIRNQAGPDEFANIMQMVDQQSNQGYAEGGQIQPQTEGVASLPKVTPKMNEILAQYATAKGVLQAPNTSDQAREEAKRIVAAIEGSDDPEVREVLKLAKQLEQFGSDIKGMMDGGMVRGFQAGGTLRNNPFNLRQTGQNWLGEEDEDGEFTSFESLPYGVRAGDRTLNTYGLKYGIDTIRDAITRWAPPNENDTEGYIEFVSRETGIPSEAPIDLEDPRTRSKLLSAMARLESNMELPEQDILDMVSGVDESEVEEGLATLPIAEEPASRTPSEVEDVPGTTPQNVGLPPRLIRRPDLIEADQSPRGLATLSSVGEMASRTPSEIEDIPSTAPQYNNLPMRPDLAVMSAAREGEMARRATEQPKTQLDRLIEEQIATMNKEPSKLRQLADMFTAIGASRGTDVASALTYGGMNMRAMDQARTAQQQKQRQELMSMLSRREEVREQMRPKTPFNFEMFKRRPENVGIPESEAWTAFQEEERARMAEEERARAEDRMRERYPLEFLMFKMRPGNADKTESEAWTAFQEEERARMAEEEEARAEDRMRERYPLEYLMFKMRPENVDKTESEVWAAFQEEERARMAEEEEARAEARMRERYPIDFLMFAALEENRGKDEAEVYKKYAQIRGTEELRDILYQDALRQLNDDPRYTVLPQEEQRQILQKRIAQIDAVVGTQSAIDYLDPASDLIIPN